MEKGVLWGYAPNSTVSDEVREVYGIVFPLFVEYVIEELIEQHVAGRKRETVREDALRRAHELIMEGRFNVRTARPSESATWYVQQEKHLFSRPDPDLRRRRSKLPRGEKLLRQYWELHRDLEPLLPRRRLGDPVSAKLFSWLKDGYPELSWSRRGDSARVTPSEAARLVLASRHGVKPGRVRKALEQARREVRRKSPPS